MRNSGGDRLAETPKYELGLVMAGAISAGAYTAGVVDFLVEALDAFEAAKENGDADCPTHDVTIRVLAGASAGGMTSGIVAAALGGEIAPVRDPSDPEAESNPFYRPWVKQIDIARLLGTNDLAATDSPVVSALDSTPLDAIADAAIRVQPSDARRRYLADRLDVILSVGNMRGVPYSLALAGGSNLGHGMLAHEDVMHFAVSRDPAIRQRAEDQGVRGLDPTDYSQENWRLLRDAALATGAFPVGLSPRVLSRPYGDYSKWKWRIPLSPDDPENRDRRCNDFRTIPPLNAAEVGEGYDYRFLAVDGGVMNNEPLEYARRVLSGLRGDAVDHAEQERNERAPQTARRGVILIDPFPNVATWDPDYEPDPAVPSVVGQLAAAWKQQARFKPDELVLADREDIYSRWMIAPTRRVDGEMQAFPIASGTLGGFGGFLDERFRAHDFQLGRRNCQRFLREHFALPEEVGGNANPNPIMARGYTASAARDRHRVTGDDGATYLPILPLCGIAAEEVPPPRAWPRLAAEDLQRLDGQIRTRGLAVSQATIRQIADGWLKRKVLEAVWRTQESKAYGAVMDWIAGDLARRDQLTEDARAIFAADAKPKRHRDANPPGR